jgi:hypothetical protein
MLASLNADHAEKFSSKNYWSLWNVYLCHDPFYFLIYLVRESIVIVKKIHLKFLMDLHILSTPEYE